MAGVTIVLRSVADVYYATTTLISPGNVVQWFVRDDNSYTSQVTIIVTHIQLSTSGCLHGVMVLHRMTSKVSDQ